MIGIGVIGFRLWGVPNLVRTFHEMPDSRVLTVSNLRIEPGERLT